MTRYSGIAQCFRRLWRWGDKWLVHIWLGIPLLFGLMGWLGGGLDQYPDFGNYAENAPRIEQTGTIKNIDSRHRYQELFAGNERIPLTCDVPANGYCIEDIAPTAARVKYFRYRGVNILVDLVDQNGNHIISEKHRVDSILRSMPSRMRDNNLHRFMIMALMSLVVVIPTMIGIFIIRIIGKLNSKNNGVAGVRQ